MAAQYTAGLTTGQVLTSATMNSIGAAWESYTPTIKGGATTVTASIHYAKWARIQKTVFVQVRATITSSGAAAPALISVSLPTGLDVVSSGLLRVIGTFMYLDSGVAFYLGGAIANTATTVVGQASGSVDYMGVNTPNVQIANLDAVGFDVMYEVA